MSSITGMTYGGIAVPEIHIDIRQRLTSVGVDELDVHIQRNTTLILSNVIADQLAAHVCCTLVD